MNQTHLRERDFNAALGEVIRQQRAAWRGDAEAVIAERQGGILEARTKRGLRADVLLQPEDLQPVVMEVKFAPGAAVEQSARERIEAQSVRNGRTIRTAFAVLAPAGAKNWRNRGEAAAKLAAGAQLQYCAFIRRPKDSPGPPVRWPETGFISGTAATLAEAAAAIATPDHEIKWLADAVAVAIRGKAKLLRETGNPIAVDRITAATGQDSRLHGMEIACCIWLNALLLQNRIAEAKHGEGLRKVEQLRSPCGVLHPCKVRAEWRRILEINRASIYQPALETLDAALNIPRTSEAIHALAERAADIENARLGPLNDIGGELFPKLTQDRKEAAQFYTRPEAAVLLAHLTIPDDAAPPGTARNWADAKGLQDARLGDFACGTGTLLRAGYRRIRALHERAGGDASAIHQPFMECCICGTDISPISYHLTASGLSAMDAMPDYGHNNIGMCSVKRGRTGALEFYIRDEIAELMHQKIRAGEQITARSGSFDFVLMNPPYSRTRKGQSAFDVAGLGEAERKLCQQRARRQFKDTAANFQAGLGSAFTVLADRKLRGGGRLGIVLPLTMAASPTWKKVRAMFARDYCRVTVVAYAAEESKWQAISEDTGMGEVMICATRLRRRAEDRKAGETPGMGLAVNISQPPRHQAESAEFASAIREAERRAGGGQAEGLLKIGSEKIGEWCRMTLSEDGAPWSAVGSGSSELVRIAEALCAGRVLFPSGTAKWKLPLPMRPLENVFEIGPTHDLIGHPAKTKAGEDTRGAFGMHPLLVGDVKKHPSLWKADAKAQTQLIAAATHYGIGTGAAGKQEKMKKLAGRLFYQRNMRWTSQALLAATTKENCMGGSAWTVLMHKSAGVRNACALWSNSTFGMIVLWALGQRQQAGRAMVKIEALRQLLTPDFAAGTQAGERARRVARKHFPRLARLQLRAAGLGFADPARREIDAAVCEMLGVPRKHRADLRRMALLLAREPGVNDGNRKILAALRGEMEYSRGGDAA
ncbi:MAG: hypothetical protein OXU53_05205 [Deltaproteobacteria bacterium]|nr:hypothetical protein [Deltaproteobacteria bacterium]